MRTLIVREIRSGGLGPVRGRAASCTPKAVYVTAAFFTASWCKIRSICSSPLRVSVFLRWQYGCLPPIGPFSSRTVAVIVAAMWVFVRDAAPSRNDFCSRFCFAASALRRMLPAGLPYYLYPGARPVLEAPRLVTVRLRRRRIATLPSGALTAILDLVAG